MITEPTWILGGLSKWTTNGGIMWLFAALIEDAR